MKVQLNLLFRKSQIKVQVTLRYAQHPVYAGELANPDSIQQYFSLLIRFHGVMILYYTLLASLSPSQLAEMADLPTQYQHTAPNKTQEECKNSSICIRMYTCSNIHICMQTHVNNIQQLCTFSSVFENKIIGSGWDLAVLLRSRSRQSISSETPNKICTYGPPFKLTRSQVRRTQGKHV